MTDLIFNLNGVPEDEAQDIRELLSSNAIAFYETTAGKWGTATAAIWLKDDRQHDLARELIAQYQRERVLRVRAEYAALREAGKAPGLLTKFRKTPLQLIFYLAVMAVIIYLSIFPFVNFGK